MTLFNEYLNYDWPSEDEDDDPDFVVPPTLLGDYQAGAPPPLLPQSQIMTPVVAQTPFAVGTMARSPRRSARRSDNYSSLNSANQLLRQPPPSPIPLPPTPSFPSPPSTSTTINSKKLKRGRPTTEEMRFEAVEKRKARNRETAAQSRARKKMAEEAEEERVRGLETANARLTTRVRELEAELERVKKGVLMESTGSRAVPGPENSGKRGTVAETTSDPAWSGDEESEEIVESSDEGESESEEEEEEDEEDEEDEELVRQDALRELQKLLGWTQESGSTLKV